MKILAIDPGTDKSVVVMLEAPDLVVSWHQIVNNDVLLAYLNICKIQEQEPFDIFAVRADAKQFETAFWAGRFWEAVTAIIRYKVKSKELIATFCAGTDLTIRDCLLDRFGGEEKAMGTKNKPGPLYGFEKEWVALALAVYCKEKKIDAK